MQIFYKIAILNLFFIRLTHIIYSALNNADNNYHLAFVKTDSLEVMDLTRVASTFPQLRDPNIQRENMIIAISEMLSSETEVVIVEGQEGIGKTTLLAQFAKEFPNNSFALFIRSSSRWAYNSSMLTSDLCDQIGWALKKEYYHDESELDPFQLLRARMLDLQRHANRENKTYYFIVDGLNDIPEEDFNEQEMILRLLPFGIRHFRFILSGPLPLLDNRPQMVTRTSTIRVVGFTFDETREFLNDLVEDRTALETIHTICKFVPGNLASVRRLLQSGMKIEQLLEDLADHLPDLLELEWRVVENEDELLSQALAVLAFDSRRHSLNSLSSLCKVESSVLEKKLSMCSFVQRRNDGEEVEFVCEGFKRLAARRLSNLKQSVLDSAITELMISSESPEALTHLPTFFHQAERYDELLDYLSPQHIGSLIDCRESWIPLHQKADLGVDTALQLKRDGDLLRFGLQRATIVSMESSEPWRSEMDAYVALNDFSAAYALVQRTVTIEDRLHLLAVIARAKKTKSLSIEVELSDQIKQLYRQLDRGSLGDKGVEIASDLLYSHPELAVELVQECMGKGESEDRLDIALAKLSFKALLEREEVSSGMESPHEALRANIKDPKIQKFMDTISLFFGDYTAEGVIAEVSKWEKGSDRIFILRSWAVTNAKREDAADVVEYALNTILKTTTYTANAKVYNELASPLIFIPDLELAKKIIGRLDGLKGTIQSAGPTLEYVKLQTLLARAEIRYNKNATLRRLENLYFDIEVLTEPGTKLAALALLARVLKVVDPDKKFEVEIDIHSAVFSDIQFTVDEILTKSADHFEAVSPAIEALASSDTKIALDVLSKLNTSPRRDAAFIQLIQTLVTEPPTEATFEAINEAYGKIKPVSMRAEATIAALKGLLGRKEELSGTLLPKVIAINEWVTAIPSAEEKCRALCIFCEILVTHKENVPSTLLESLFHDLESAFDAIDEGWSKIDSGYKIVALMAKCFPELCQTFLSKTEKARSEIVLECPDTAMTYLVCVDLALRCFGGFLKRRLYNENDLNSLKELINKIPSTGVRARVWSELALKFFIAHDLQACRDVVSQRIRPILESDDISDIETRWQVIVSVAPALYVAHNISAKKLIDTLPYPNRDEAYREICNFIITKQLPTEGYDPEGKPTVKITYEECLDLFSVMQFIEIDQAIYHLIESLVDNVHKRFNREFNNQQRADMVRQLRNLTKTKFPNQEYIRHEGYKILAEAQIARLIRVPAVWEDLPKRARAIPNVADSAFVLMGIAAAMPVRSRRKAIQLFREAKQLIPQIAIFEDRCGHYELLAKLSAETDRVLSKECLRDAWNETMPYDIRNLPKAKKRIVDFAHRLDPEFAASLASETEDDSGREFARAQTKDRINVLNLRERVASGESDAMGDLNNVEQQVEVAQMMLFGLNSNRVNPIHIDSTRQFIKQASQMKVEDAYIVLSWVIENAVRRYSNTDQANTIIRSLFEAARLSAELSFRIAERIRSITVSSISVARRSNSSSDNLIRPGEKDKALCLLKEWASKATGFIKITDPYFGLQDLEFVKLIRSENCEIPIFILTSRKSQKDAGVTLPWDETYQTYWRINLSDSDAGNVRIVVIGRRAAGDHPIHDRWWLTENGGLRVGTSANSLGIGKITEVSVISDEEAASMLMEVDRHLNPSVSGDESDKYTYQSFFL